jgi:hypothetical protein
MVNRFEQVANRLEAEPSMSQRDRLQQNVGRDPYVTSSVPKFIKQTGRLVVKLVVGVKESEEC